MANDQLGNVRFDLDTADVGGMSAIVDPLAGLEFERPVQTARSPGMPTISLGEQGFNCAKSGTVPLYLDLETAPDEERMHLFDLPELPDVRPETTSANCPTPETMLEASLDQLERELMDLNPDDAFLELLVATERRKVKPRAGVSQAVGKVRNLKYAAVNAERDRLKEMSVTPEFCRIVAVGWAVGDLEPRSTIVGVPNAPGVQPQTEANLLSFLWELISRHSPIVGFNVLGFDLQVLRARSVLLGVEPSKLLNDSPWNNRDVTDLMAVRFGKGGKAIGLKRLAKLYGISVPAGDATGGDVLHLLANDPGKLGEYVRSDVWITRELHKRWSGYFCV